MTYRSLVPDVSQAIKSNLHDEMRSYFDIIARKCAQYDPALYNLLKNASNLHQHCSFTWQPLTTEVRETGVHFNVVSVPDAANGYVLNLIAKNMGQRVADDFEYNVMPECLTAYHWNHVK